MAGYPDALPELREVENDPGVAYDPLQKNVVFAEDINNIAAEILAIVTELGTLPKGTFADVKARLADMTSKTATAQSTANSKANKQTGVMAMLASDGWSSYDKTSGSCTANTAYWLEDASSSNPMTLNVSGAHSNVTVELFLMGMIGGSSPTWVQCQLWLDGAAHGGWRNLFAEPTVRSLARFNIGLSISGTGNHTIQFKYRTTATVPSVRIINPSCKVFKTVNI